MKIKVSTIPTTIFASTSVKILQAIAYNYKPCQLSVLMNGKEIDNCLLAESLSSPNTRVLYIEVKNGDIITAQCSEPDAVEFDVK